MLRLLDANLDRAREGLRVAEDWARFGLDRRDLVEGLKDLRQQLGRRHLPRYRQARHTATDSAAGLAHPAAAAAQRRHRGGSQLRPRPGGAAGWRNSAAADPELARVAEHCRYRLYDLETRLADRPPPAAGG